MARRIKGSTPSPVAAPALPTPTTALVTQMVTTRDRENGGLWVEHRQVLDAWAAGNVHSAQTLARMSETVTRFTRRLQATGVGSFAEVDPAHACGFITAAVAGGAPPQVATQHARRTAIRTLYRTLRAVGFEVADPTLDLALPARGTRAARPLTDDEITLCRASAQMVTRQVRVDAGDRVGVG